MISSYALLLGGLLPADAESVVPTAVVVVVVVVAAGHFVVADAAAVVVVAVVTGVSAGAAAGWAGQPAVAVVVAGADYLPFSINYTIGPEVETKINCPFTLNILMDKLHHIMGES